MKIDKEIIDKLSKEIDAFDTEVPGIRFGEDYPEFALAMVGSESFNGATRAAVLMSLMDAVMSKSELESRPASDKSGEFVDAMMKKSSLRSAMLRMAYLGYRLGKMKEVESVNSAQS